MSYIGSTRSASLGTVEGVHESKVSAHTSTSVSFNSLSLDQKKDEVKKMFAGDGVMVRTIPTRTENMKIDFCTNYLEKTDLSSSGKVYIKRMSWIKEDKDNMLYKFGGEGLPRNIGVLYDPGKLGALVLKVSTHDESSNGQMDMDEIRACRNNREGVGEDLGKEMLRKTAASGNSGQNNEVVTLPSIQDAIVGFVVLGDETDKANLDKFQGSLNDLAEKGSAKSDFQIEASLQGKTYPVFFARPDASGAVQKMHAAANGITIPTISSSVSLSSSSELMIRC